MRSFNSRLVRLKDCFRQKNVGHFTSFQFQIGAIKGFAFLAVGWPSIVFQFQIGAIKGKSRTNEGFESVLFQFQIGAIKGLPYLILI